MDDVKTQFANHLAGIGFELNAPRQTIMEKLRQRMGEERFNQTLAVMKRARSTTGREELYKHFDDLVEANLLRSLDPGATLEASYSLYQRCASRLGTGVRVTELGCWTGGLASFIATRHPECSVTGVDAAQGVIDACKVHYRLPNLSFRQWNYRFGKPEDLEPADVLLCSMGVGHRLPENTILPDPAAVRRSPEYAAQHDQARGYFSVWRSAARDGALLYAVFRLQLFPRFLAWVDAAQATGWTPLLDRLWHVDVPAEKQPLPGFVFEAGRADPLAEEAVLERWTWYRRRADLFARQEGGAALAAYRALRDKSVLATREYRPQGVSTRDEVGSVGGIGYVFTHNATSQFRLLFVSAAQAKALAAGVSVKGSATPITDEGVFQTAAAPASPFSPGGPPAAPVLGGASPPGGAGGDH